MAEEYRERDWEGMAESGQLTRLRIQDLQVYLKFNGLPVSGKKADLIERISQHVKGVGRGPRHGGGRESGS